jgi:hypothetical protein
LAGKSCFAQIGDVSLAISELEFKKGLTAAGNLAEGTLHTVFNELTSYHSLQSDEQQETGKA